MTRLFYRGFEHETQVKPAQTLAEQMRRPVLTYRGVEHDGEQPVTPAPSREIPMFYRGQRFA